MIPRYIMKTLDKIKYAYPEIKFICEGDPEQTRPVGDEDVNWMQTNLLHNLCDGNMYELTTNKRNDETSNYHKILQGEDLLANKYGSRVPQSVNICRTNAMRITINDMLMDRTGLFLSKNKANKHSQDIWLTLNTPVMAIKNNKKKDIKNGKIYMLKSIDETTIKICNENSFTHQEFTEHFVVAYAYTNHKIQGLTIKECFNIYEWNKMSKREQYTAYSRTSDGHNVKIVNSLQPNYNLYNELQIFFKDNYCIYKWSSEKCNDFYIGHTKNFDKRKAEHLKAALVETNKVYVKMRDIGIENWTMEKIHSFYACDRLDAEKVEQEFITKLQPSLNMVNSWAFARTKI